MEPPDPGGSFPHDPGSTIPPPACFITIASNESGMETDTSIVSTSASKRKLKRPHTNKVCRHCNKRRRSRNSTEHILETDCSCDLVESNNENTINTIKKQSMDLNNIQPSWPQPMATPVGRNTYQNTDLAPFIIHVQRERESINQNNNTTIHPVVFGKFLAREKFQGIVNGSLKKIGRNRMSLAFTHFDKANDFIHHDSLKKNEFKAYIPTFNVTRMGLVRGVPAEWSPEEIIENVNLPIGCGKILKIRRLNYKTSVDGSPVWKPSQTVVLTFDGQVLPKRIFICYNALPVELYTYPTVQCYNCARYGHTKLQCRSPPRCYKCGLEHTGDSCDVSEDMASCCHCSGSHFATNKRCPELDRQKRIKRSMAESCISYSEANKLHPPVIRSYADITTSRPSPHLTHSPKSIPSSTSYKKTVFKQPRSPHHTPPKGYNQSLHREIIKEFDIPSPANGCAYKDSPNTEERSIIDIILTLINSLIQSTVIKPDHAASIIETINKLTHVHNGPNP